MYEKLEVPVYDIRQEKNEIRNKYKQIRKNMAPAVKKEKDFKIFTRIINSIEYKNCKILLTYVSTEIEVDTIMLINHAINDGKIVAVPKCVSGTRNMEFYIIKSISDLSTGAFSVLEPNEDSCQRITSFANSICIVPALVYDLCGFRLGYGKGYYDRFISAHKNIYRIGIGYCCCTVNKLNRGRYDMPVNMLITEKYSKCFKQQ